MSTCQASLPPLASLKKDKPVATLIECSDGVQIVRAGTVLFAAVGHTLQLGDRVVVCQGGRARAVFQEQGGQVVWGTFEGRCDASLVYFSRHQGSCSVVFDVTVGKVELSLSISGASAPEIHKGRPKKRTSVGFHCYSKPIGR